MIFLVSGCDGKNTEYIVQGSRMDYHLTPQYKSLNMDVLENIRLKLQPSELQW